MKKNENVSISDEKKMLLMASAIIATGAVYYLYLKQFNNKSSSKNEQDKSVKIQFEKLNLEQKKDHRDLFSAYTNARVILDHRNRTAGSGERDDVGETLPPLESPSREE